MDRVLTVDQERGYTSPPRRSPFFIHLFCRPPTTSMYFWSEAREWPSAAAADAAHPIHHSSFQCLILSWKGKENGGEGGGSGRPNKFLKQPRCVCPHMFWTPVYSTAEEALSHDRWWQPNGTQNGHIYHASSREPCFMAPPHQQQQQVSTGPREMDDFCSSGSSRTTSFDICVP